MIQKVRRVAECHALAQGPVFNPVHYSNIIFSQRNWARTQEYISPRLTRGGLTRYSQKLEKDPLPRERATAGPHCVLVEHEVGAIRDLGDHR
jgi:hypothetical protein